MKPDILKQSLRQSPIPANAHGPLLQELWGRDSIGEKSKNVLDMSPFWEYYSKRAKRSFLDRAHPFFLEDHADVVPIFQSVLSDSSREDIKHDILVRHNKPTVAAGKAGAAVTAADINDAIDLCASLATMTEVKLDSKSGGLTGRHVIQWTEGSLRQALASHFVPQTRLDHSGNSKLGKQFTARNLVRIGGIKVKWTTCLTNHLRLVDDDQVVFIFHCVSFLQLQERWGDPVHFRSSIRG